MPDSRGEVVQLDKKWLVRALHDLHEWQIALDERAIQRRLNLMPIARSDIGS